MVPQEVLLSVSGGMGLHSCIAQVDFGKGLWFGIPYAMKIYEFMHV